MLRGLTTIVVTLPLSTALVSAMVAGLLTVLAPAADAAGYRPRSGVMFNNPYGRRHAQERILVHIRNSIDHAPRGSLVQLAAYSFDRPDIGDALLRAWRRGVRVQLLLNDNWTSQQTKRLLRRIGDDTSADSFVKICYRSCRGGPGNQHAKFYLFSRTGAARNVVMVGSSNLTGYGAKNQFNDMFTVIGAPRMLRVYRRMFEQMERDRWVKHPWRSFRTGRYTSRFFPHHHTTLDNDPVLRRLRQVRCRAVDGTGSHGHTVIRIAMFGWVGDRGRYLAKKVASLQRHGCRIRVIISSGGGAVARILKAGGVLVKNADMHQRKDGSYRKYTHEKWMILDGTFHHEGTHRIWTGSENWSGMSLRNDDVTVEFPGRGYYHRYLEHFAWEWKHHTRWI